MTQTPTLAQVPRVDTVLLKVASRCNLNCSYCYVYHSGDVGWQRQPKKMSFSTVQAVVDALACQARTQEGGFAVVLHGGEPLLGGIDLLGALLTGLREALPETCPLSLQTNGTLLNDEFVELFIQTRTSVSVSIDGPRRANDLARVDHAGKSSFEATCRGLELLRNHPRASELFAGTLSVIQLGADPRTAYDFLKQTGTRSMDFLLQDGNHDRLPAGKGSTDSVEYGQWLSRLFDVYVEDPDPPRIRILDDLAKLCLGGRGRKEGIGEASYGILIVDTDGTFTKNDTLKNSEDGADRYASDWNIASTPVQEVLKSEEFRSHTALQTPTSTTCKECSYLGVCGGGMPLFRWSSEGGYDNPSVYCADHRYLIDHMRAYLRRVADQAS